MAKVYEKRGRWCIDYFGADGKRRRELQPAGTSNALAKDILAKKLAETAEMRHFPARVVNAKLFGAVLDQFWELHGKHLLSGTWGYMVRDIRAEFGTCKVGAIGPADIQRFYLKIVARSSNATANRFLTLLRSVFNKAKVWGEFYGDNPCTAIKKLREAPGRLRYLSLDEIKRLLETAHPRLYPVAVCALMTGMRKGEILRLSWEHIDLERGLIYILQSKSGKPREIPIGAKLQEIFLRLGGGKRGRVFELPEIMIRRYFDRALKEAGISDFRFHDLRHTFASHFIMRTNDLPALQRLLGHSTPMMTLRYAHLSQAHMRSGMAQFEAGLLLDQGTGRAESLSLAQGWHKPPEARPGQSGILL